MSCEYEIEDLFEVVIEPDHSRLELINLQKKYNLATADLLQHDILGVAFAIPEKEIRNWLFQYEMYVNAQGDPTELIAEHFSWIMDDKDGLDFDDPFLKTQLQTSLDKREVDMTSLSF